MNLVHRWYVIQRLKRQFYGFDRRDLERHQEKALDDVLRFVLRNSAYYRNRYGVNARFEEMKPVGRSEMMKEFNRINTAGLDRDTLVQFRIESERTGSPDFYSGGYSVGLSSGTTGSRLLTVLSEEERDLYTCLLWTRSGIPRQVKTKRVLFSLRTYNRTFTQVEAFGVRMVYVDYTHPVDELVGIINTNRLNILAGPPSLLLLLEQARAKINGKIDVLISYAEVLDDRARVRLETAFGAPVVQIYQGAEGFIGSTCRDGFLHINEDVLLLETIGDPAAGPVKVLVTDLYRRTQPLIRYELDDLLEIDLEACTCGSVFRRIRRIQGRGDDVFVLYDPSGAPRYLFPDYIRRAINQASESVLEYQVLQHAPDRMEVRMELADETLRPEIERKVVANLEWRIGQIGASLPVIEFSDRKPARNEQSQKLVRVTRKFPWEL